MKAKAWRRAITVSAVMAALFAVLAVNAFLTTVAIDADSTYSPVTTLKMCNAMPASFPDPDIAGNPACADNLTNSAAADNTNTLNLPSGDLNFSNVVTLAPNSETINVGSVAAVGTKIGGLHSDTTLGLLNAACSSLVPINFVFYNVALPSNLSDPRSTGGSPETQPAFVDGNGTGSSTNIAFPQTQGVTDRFSHWKVGAEADGTGAGGDQAVTYSGVLATGATLSIQNYPSYLLDVFDPDFVPGVSDGPIKPLVPLAVYGAISNVTGTSVPLYFAQFSSGGIATLPAPLGLVSADMGQPSVSVLNDPSEVQPSPNSITSFCTPLAITTTLLGTSVAGGHVRATNPSTVGTGFFQQFSDSLRDLDQDGNENALDSCPTIPDAAHDPRNPANPSDSDADGIGDACDSVSNPGVQDSDSDTFQNRQDNCPQMANPDQKQSSLGFAQADNGPRADGIGDACESGTATFMQNGQSVTVSLTDHTVAHGRFMVSINVVPKCFGGIDADGDGYCTGQDTGTDSGTCTGTVPPSCTVLHNAWGAGLSGSVDTDKDGFSDAAETYLATDPQEPCARTPVPPATAGGVNDESINGVDVGSANTGGDNWPFDFNDDRLAGLADVSSYAPRFGRPINHTGSTAYDSKRWDLNENGIISLSDITKFSTVFGKRCGQGTPGLPGPWH